MPHNARNGGSVPCRLTEISDASAAQVADLFLGTFALIIQCYCLSILFAPVTLCEILPLWPQKHSTYETAACCIEMWVCHISDGSINFVHNFVSWKCGAAPFS